MSTRLDKRKIAVLTAISSLALLTGCGQSPQPPAPPVAPAPAPVAGPGAACVPINTAAMIPFTATNMLFGNGMVKAGQIPGQQVFGQVMIGGAAPVAGTPGAMFRGQRVDGTSISLTLSAPLPVATAPGVMPQVIPGSPQAAASATGVIQVSPQIQQMLIQRAMQISGGGAMVAPGMPIFPQPGMIPQPGAPVPAPAGNVCVSGIAIDLRHTISSQWLYLGSIYFYLQGTQNGLALDF